MTIALAIPHTPWVPERAESMQRLRDSLGVPERDVPYREFTERAPNWEWSIKLWQWLYETGAEWCLQLQDDVMVAPSFWLALRAMTEALPPEAEIIGLSATHPLAPEWQRRGHRWYRTPGMLIGWAYMLRRSTLGAFLEEQPGLVKRIGKSCEDVLLGSFAAETQRFVWHPCPTICDHDTSIPSSYANDHHSTRRPQVTWRDFGEGSLTDPSWWKVSGLPQLLPMPPQRNCWFCLQKGVCGESALTGAGICGQCMGKVLGSWLQGGRQ